MMPFTLERGVLGSDFSDVCIFSQLLQRAASHMLRSDPAIGRALALEKKRAYNKEYEARPEGAWQLAPGLRT